MAVSCFFAYAACPGIDVDELRRDTTMMEDRIRPEGEE
jgi:hypothetical protein